jgi:hypothetical protein
VMTLHLGEMERQEGYTRLIRPDYKDISKIFEWVYHDFTHERLGPKWWQRLINWLRD